MTGKPVALEARPEDEDGRRFSPSIGRNRQVVAETFTSHILHDARVLEIASGTGEHGFYLTQHSPELKWTYSDIDPVSQTSQAAWKAFAGHDRLDGPLTLNVTQLDWAKALRGQYTAMFCANMIHIAPFDAAKGLICGAGEVLPAQGRFMLYGPFARRGEIAPSNARFSEDLKRRDPSWGVRDLELDILPLANRAGLDLHDVVEMPASNLSVIFERRVD